jgi:hypothetical protein
MDIEVWSVGSTKFAADTEYQEPVIREAIDQRGDVADVILDYTDSERSNISYDEYARVTGDVPGLVLFEGWLTGDRNAPPPAGALASEDVAARHAAEAGLPPEAAAIIAQAVPELANALGLLDPLHALAAKWDATAARNQRNGQSLIDQGDEYGSEGLAVAEALGACVVELRAVLSDAPPPKPAPGLAAPAPAPRADADRLLDWAARLIVAAAEGADVSSGGWRTEQRDWLSAFNATPPAPRNAEVAYEQWIERRDPMDAGSMAGFLAGWQAAVTAASGWPLCPNGCGCRLGSEDADARDCACDGLCCYDEIEVSEVFAERDGLRKALRAIMLAVDEVETGTDAEAAQAAGSARAIARHALEAQAPITDQAETGG